MTARARADPGRAARASRLREMGVAASAAGHPATGARHLRRALRLLGWPDGWRQNTELIGRTLISLAHAEAEQGRVAAGLELLDQAEALLAPDTLGILLQQRGLLLQRLGRAAEALPLLDAAVPLLSRAGETVVLARTLLNRAALHLSAGRVSPARDDLRRSAGLARLEKQHLLAAKVLHAQGYCGMVSGDIAVALSDFDEAANEYLHHGPGFVPVVRVDKARVLLAAGLSREAGHELDEALRLFRKQRLSQDYAEAELFRARVALASGDLDTAYRWANRAVRHARRRGNEAWVSLADLTRLTVLHQRGQSPGMVAARAARVADRLRGQGLEHDAAAADLLAIRGLVKARHQRRAEAAALALAPPRRSTPLETRLLHRLVRAEVAASGGQRSRVLRHARAGLAALHRHRSRLGSVDLQSGTAALGVELARIGLTTALDSGSPRLVFAWSERSRAQAFRVRPIRPPADPATADAVTELRHLHLLIRAAELDGQAAAAHRARRAELERLVRERAWQAPGTGESNATATVDDVAAEVAAVGRTMIVFVRSGARLVALVVRDNTVRLCPLGHSAAAEEAARRLLSDLDALNGRYLTDRLRNVVLASIDRQCGILTEHLLTPLHNGLSEDALVLVPTGWLSAVPWSLLPPLAGRPITVAPSATVWLNARVALATRHTATGPPLLVAGPHLAHAADEVHAIAAIVPRSRVLHGDTATVEATLGGLEGASLAHFATHGHHEPDNVLFSRLDLTDGPLMAYDLQHLAVPPHRAVLSACDLGRTVVRAGDEVLGFTAALLYAGTTSVISSMVRVPDEIAIQVMASYYRRLADGHQPAQALAHASGAHPLVPFVCFGAG